MLKVKVKVCGVTNIDDAKYAIKCGADYLGLIFAKSKRKMIKEGSQRIVKATPEFNNYVGVFLNQKKREIQEICEYANIKIIQLHGDETPAFCNYFSKRGYLVIKAIRVKNKETLKQVSAYGVKIKILFDTYRSNAYGGTGEVFDWNIINDSNYLKNRDYFISGGIDASNVGKLISLLHPFGVDASSLLEKSPGLKDKRKVKSFFDALRRAL